MVKWSIFKLDQFTVLYYTVIIISVHAVTVACGATNLIVPILVILWQKNGVPAGPTGHFEGKNDGGHFPTKVFKNKDK